MPSGNMGKTISLDDYLVRLGFNLDATGFNQFLELLDKGKRGVEQAIPAISSSLIKATTVYTGFVAQAAVGIASLVQSVSQMDRDLAIQARGYWMQKDAFTEMSYAAEALGYSMNELSTIALSPELTQQFYELMAISKQLQPTQELQDNLKLVRSLSLEFNKIKLAGRYFVYNLAGEIAKFLGTDITDLKNDLKDINKFLSNDIKPATERIAAIVGPFMKQVKQVAWPVLKLLFSGASTLFNTLTKNPQTLTNLISILKVLLIVLSLLKGSPLGLFFVLAPYILKILGRIAEQQGKTGSFVRTIDKLLGLLDRVGGILTTIFDIAGPLIDMIADGLSRILDILEPIIALAMDALNIPLTLLETILGMNENIANGNVGGWLKDMFMPENLIDWYKQSAGNNSYNNSRTSNITINNNNSIYGSDSKTIANDINDMSAEQITSSKAFTPAY